MADGRADSAAEGALGAELRMMLAAFWASRERRRLILLALALVAVVGATAYAQILLNAWNRPFYDALTRRDSAGFMHQLGVFAGLAGALLVLNVTQMWLNQTSRIVLRRGLVNDLLDRWLAPLRAFRLANAGEIGANPDQRVAADAQHLTDLTTDLGIGLLQASLLLFSFIGVLWELSSGMSMTVGGVTFAPPGYMVWWALFYAGAASALSWRVGRPLIRLDAEHYAREADLRYELVRVSQSVEAIALYGGEAAERARLDQTFEALMKVLRRIVGAVTGLTWVTAGYGWFTLVAPILVAAPSYFAGRMTFGELMMAVGAFNQVQQSLRWFVDNFSAIADWRATLLRVASFREAAEGMDRLGAEAGRIETVESPDGGLHFSGLCISGPAGTVRLKEDPAVIAAGERVLVTGGHGASKTLFFRALNGIWPWGRGRIARPATGMMFVPARAYLPTGTLRACVTYPLPEDAFPAAAVSEVLEAVGLGRLATDLTRFHRWDRHLSVNEAQCLAFARALLQRPAWLVIDDALTFLEPVARARIERLLIGRLEGTAILSIGHDGSVPGFYHRTLELELDPDGPCFVPGEAARS